MTQYSKANLFANRYILNHILGEGGMGIVYHATDRLTHNNVALKQVFAPVQSMVFTTPKQDSMNDSIALAREFQTLASLRHPNIISVLDYGFHNDIQETRPYFTMTLLHNAKNIIEASANINSEGKLHLLIQVLQALEYLHQRGIIHHDLKPANILVDNEQIKLLDFGLAMSPGDSIGVMGTLPYMAPEVLREEKITLLSDLYAVGVIAYELFAGFHPFNVKNIQKLIQDILINHPDTEPFENDYFPNEIVPISSNFNLASTVIVDPEELNILHNQVDEMSNAPISASQSSATNKLGQIIFRLLSKNPSDRYPSANAVLKELYALTNSSIILETPEIRESFLQAASFVGREKEQKTLEDAVQKTKQFLEGSAWLVGGESGVGKTRLLNEIRVYAMVHGVLVVTGQGVREGGLPYQLWRDVIRRLCINVELTDLEASVLKAVVPDIEDLLSRKVDDAPVLQSKENQIRLINILKQVIIRYGQPLLLLLEDIQWGAESLAILQAVVEICQEAPVMILASFRDDEASDVPQKAPNMEFIRLERLNRTEISLLSQAILGDLGQNQAIIELLHQETEGNVFFVIETVRELAEHAGKLSNIRTMELPTSIFPNGIKDIVQRRLQNIDMKDLYLLQIAAVLGRELDMEFFAKVVAAIDANQQQYINQWLITCTSESLIEAHGEEWHFTHDKFRQEILNQIPTTRRRYLHEQVALMLEQQMDNEQSYAATLAYHWHMANNLEKEAHYTSIAATKAAQQGVTKAAEMLERCVELYNILKLDNIDWHLDNLTTLSMSYSSQGHNDKALSIIESIIKLIEQHDKQDRLPSVYYRRGSTTVRQGKFEDAKQDLSQALDMVRDNDHELKSQILMWLGAIAIIQESFDESNRYLEESLQIAQTHGSINRNVASILNTQAENMRSQGRLDEAIQYFKQSIASYSQIGHTYAVIGVPINLGHTYLSKGDIEEAEQTFFGVIKHSLAQKNMLFTMGSLAGIAGVCVQREEFIEAAEWFGLVMRHPQSSAEIRVTMQNAIEETLKSELGDQIFERAFQKHLVADAKQLMNSLVTDFYSK